MTEHFLNIFNRSISASWLILAVLVLRLLLKKAPKWVHVLLWGLVAVRLVCPFSIESIFSLIPSVETIPTDIMFDNAPAIDSGIDAINQAVNPMIHSSFAPNPGDSANPLQLLIPAITVIWYAGLFAMVTYAIVSYKRLQHKVETAVRYRDNIYQSENVASPFVLGVFRPKIYLPFQLQEQDVPHIIAHEQAHIRRKDHWWKFLGFAFLCRNWFNPLMWLAYVLLCRDIELACDERVIKELENEQRADYTQALVACSVKRRMVAACPLAFGEVGVKERVKSVMHYRKPGFWVILLAVIISLITALCFLTNPKTKAWELLKPGTTWVNEEHGIVFSMDEDKHIEGTANGEIISVGWRYAGLRNMVFDVFAGDWETAQTSAEEPLLTGILTAKRGKLILEVDTDRLGLGEESIVFVSADVSGIGGADGPTAFLTSIKANRVIGYSALYSEELIDAAMDAAEAAFEDKNRFHVLLELRYGEEIENRLVFSRMIEDYWDRGMELIPIIATSSIYGGGTGNYVLYLVRTDDKMSWEMTGAEVYKKCIDLNEIIILSQYGYDLHWTDFEDYPYVETGSGLYIRVYEINEMYELWIGGTDTDSEPMYIYLTLADDPNTKIDIRDGGVTEFLAAQQ